MLEEMYLDQSVASIVMVGSTEMKVDDNIIEKGEHVLHHNEKDTPMYGVITEVCDDVKKVMGEVMSLLTGNGLCDLLCEKSRESSFKCTIGGNHAHTGKYLWGKDDTTTKMTSDGNDKIVNTESDQSEMEMDQNHTYVDI